MDKKLHEKLTNLDIISATIVNEMKSIGIYRYNKIIYLFEYFFVKNFGFRYLNEKFIKYPHGPVISNYKKQIRKLYELGIYDVDVDELNKKRIFDDYVYQEILIKSTSKTSELITNNIEIFTLINAIINKFGNLSIDELEEIVYKTSPLKNYMEKFEMGWKKKTGSYILSDCIKPSSYITSKTQGRKLALMHLSKYPEINFELQKKMSEEVSDLIKMRPNL